MTVTVIQIGLDPEVIDYSSCDIRRWYPEPEGAIR